MTSHERQHWHRLATRALQRVATSGAGAGAGAGAVSEAVADLQAAVPPIAISSGAAARIEAEAAYRRVFDSCGDARSEVETWSFTVAGQIACVRRWCLTS